MSDSINAKAELAGWARQLSHMFIADLKHMPESSFTQPQGGKCRTVADMVAEVSGLNMMAVSAINGNAPAMPSEEERAGYVATLTTPEACIHAIESSSEALAQALSDASDAALSESFTAPWGMTLSKYQFANIAANNMWYHDGQLNYIHMLNGDDKIYWMGD
jgi:hypothetical protein